MNFYFDSFNAPTQQTAAGRTPSDHALQMKVRDMNHQIQRLALMNQALWELLRDRLHATDAELEQYVEAIDLRDGVADGKMTVTALKCPKCGRVSSSKHWKCLYCGVEFQKPIMG